jgi:hypothetical protein
MASAEPDRLSALDVTEAASTLERLLVGRGRGQEESDEDFKALRKRLIKEAPDEVVPEFLKTVRNLDQFWAYIRKWEHYAERDEQIWSAFAPLHDALERQVDGEPGSEAVVQEATAESYRPQVTDSQRAVLETLHRIYLDTHDWPTHAYLEQELEEHGVELDDELRTMPELIFYPDNRRAGGVLHFQEGDKIALMIRGLVACRGVEREIQMLVGTIKWAVVERRSVRQQPHELTTKTWRASDAMGAMGDAINTPNPFAYECKLLLELMRNEPVELPQWGGMPDAFPDWSLDIPTGIKRFKDVETIDDYLKETHPKPPPRFETGSALPMWPETVGTVVAVPDSDHPIFGRPVRRTHTFDCFVLLPLSEPFKTIYAEAVEPVAAELGISCGHAGGIVGPGRIMKDIYSSITHAQVIVAELTGRNPNVFYELGIAHEQRKQVVLLTQKIEDVPFDIRDLRVVIYDWDEAAPDSAAIIESLRPHLEEALRAARNGS